MTWLGGVQAAGAEEEDEEELDESKYFDMRLRMMQKLEVRAGMGGLKTRRADHYKGSSMGCSEVAACLSRSTTGISWLLLTHGGQR